MPRHTMIGFAAFVGTWFIVAGCAGERIEPASEAASTGAAPSRTFSVEAADAAGFAAAESPAGGEATAVPDGVKPRIIYTAEIRLVAEDFAKASEQLKNLVAEVEGYIATATLDRSSGQARSGTWTVRVPIAKYERFIDSLDSLAFVESRDQRSEDVTMEYVDVEARIKNRKQLEDRLVTLLAENTGKLEDVLRVEQELARIRGEIEQAEGRLRYLTNKTDFSTVTVSIREQKDYVPPRAPLFGERIAVTWTQSLAALRRTAEFIVLAVVAIVPWLIVAAIPVIALVVTLRLALRRRSTPRI
jgi:hypothetical protein